MTKLNLWTDSTASGSLQSSAGGCSVSKDKVVYNSTKCGGVNIPTSSSADFGSASCIVLSSYTLAQLTSRYSNKFSSCNSNPDSSFTSVEDAITQYLTSIKGYMSTMQTKLSSIKTSMTTLKDSHDSLSDLIISQALNMKNFKLDIQEFLNTITGDEGVITKLNCRFIGDNLERMTKALCVKFIPSIFWFSFLLGFMGCCACCSMPCTFFLNRNLAVNKQVY